MNDDLIFISIAAYRDSELTPTVAVCLEKASHPERLRFGVCWQHAVGEEHFPYLADSRFRVLSVPWQDSRGVCWARAQVMGLWSGETYYLQIDSHSRFAPGWDETLIAALRQCEADRPILTTYPEHYEPGEPDNLSPVISQMTFRKFDTEGLPCVAPEPMRSPGHDGPIRARFLAGGFLFTTGDFVRDVPYDPSLYFFGEEISMAVRAFTHGFDLFHPREGFVWHYYTRPTTRRHWLDHTVRHSQENAWRMLDLISRYRVRQLLKGKEIGCLGLGRARTLAEYEAYAGIDFQRQEVTEATREGIEPLCPPLARPVTRRGIGCD